MSESSGLFGGGTFWTAKSGPQLCTLLGVLLQFRPAHLMLEQFEGSWSGCSNGIHFRRSRRYFDPDFRCSSHRAEWTVRQEKSYHVPVLSNLFEIETLSLGRQRLSRWRLYWRFVLRLRTMQVSVIFIFVFTVQKVQHDLVVVRHLIPYYSQSSLH